MGKNKNKKEDLYFATKDLKYFWNSDKDLVDEFLKIEKKQTTNRIKPNIFYEIKCLVIFLFFDLTPINLFFHSVTE